MQDSVVHFAVLLAAGRVTTLDMVARVTQKSRSVKERSFLGCPLRMSVWPQSSFAVADCEGSTFTVRGLRALRPVHNFLRLPSACDAGGAESRGS